MIDGASEGIREHRPGLAAGSRKDGAVDALRANLGDYGRRSRVWRMSVAESGPRAHKATGRVWAHRPSVRQAREPNRSVRFIPETNHSDQERLWRASGRIVRAGSRA